MAIALDVLGFAILSGLVFVWIAFLYFTYHRLRRKGYQPPGASLALLVVCAVAIVLTVLGFPASTDALTGYRFLAYAFYLPIGLSMALMMVVALTLPGRRARRFGRRTSRFPFRLFGGAIVSLGVFVAVYAVAAFFFVPDWKADGAGEAVAFLITVGLYVIWFGRRSQH
nr:hypothetical protein [Gemmatimonadaceae bacterium]